MPELKNENHEEDVATIQSWIAKQPHLPQKIDDLLIKRFLHTCNYSLEKSKNLIDLFFTIRSQAPEIFAKRDPNDIGIQNIFNVTDMVPLPNLTKENYKVFIYRLATSDAEKYNFVDSLRTFFMVSDVRMVSEDTFPDGEVPIFDMEGFSLRHLTKVTLPILKKYMIYTQEAHPIKLKQIHVINVSPFLDRCLALVKPLMKSEVASMLHFHLPNSTTLYDYVPKKLLPEDYGGEAGKMSELKAEWIKKIMEKRDYFRDEDRWHVDEGRRPIENQHGKQMFGMQGSFRTLAID